MPPDPLRNPQLSDFGLSQYAFSRPWSAAKGQHTTNTCQENLKSRTPVRAQTPCILAKTPKCTLKMDDYECVTPRLEHFGISEHTMCMNEDYTMSLIRKTAQANKKWVNYFASGCSFTEVSVVSSWCTNFLLLPFSFSPSGWYFIIYQLVSPGSLFSCTLSSAKQWNTSLIHAFPWLRHSKNLPYAIYSQSICDLLLSLTLDLDLRAGCLR